MLVFDDSYEHEVWNETSNPRIILIIDLVHPDITQVLLNAAHVHSYAGFNGQGKELLALTRIADPGVLVVSGFQNMVGSGISIKI